MRRNAGRAFEDGDCEALSSACDRRGESGCEETLSISTRVTEVRRRSERKRGAPNPVPTMSTRSFSSRCSPLNANSLGASREPLEGLLNSASPGSLISRACMRGSSPLVLLEQDGVTAGGTGEGVKAAPYEASEEPEEPNENLLLRFLRKKGIVRAG